MRFLYKRQQMEAIHEELEAVMEVMASDLFVYLDLFVFSLIFTLLLSPIIKTLALSILFLFVCYGLFCCLYAFVFNRLFKNG